MNKPKIKEVEEDRKEFYQKTGSHGVLNPKDCEPQELLEKTYENNNRNMKDRSLFSHTSWVNPDRAVELLDFLPAHYNLFNREDIKDMLEMVEDTWVSLGRESSVVIYFWTEQPETIKDLIRSFNPSDEFFITKNGKDWVWDIPNSEQYSLVRAWWD